MRQHPLENKLVEKLLQRQRQTCFVCNRSRNLRVFHHTGNEYLELEFFKTREKMYQNYLDNFDKESNYVTLICERCKLGIQEPTVPNLAELEKLYAQANEYVDFTRVIDMYKKYPHTHISMIRISARWAREERESGQILAGIPSYHNAHEYR